MPVAEKTAAYHDRRVQQRLESDPEYRAEYKRVLRQIRQIDALVNELDALREKAGISKAELARAIGKDPASVRRFFSAQVNPELKTVTAIADALGAKVTVQPRGRRASPAAAGRAVARKGTRKTTARRKVTA